MEKKGDNKQRKELQRRIEIIQNEIEILKLPGKKKTKRKSRGEKY